MTKQARPAIVSTVDYHTAGEPFRIVTGGVPVPAGRTVADRRVSAAASLDHIRRLLVSEPRGHPAMYGCFVTPPDDDGAELGAIFFHQSGFSTACGHGTIALATWAVQAAWSSRTGRPSASTCHPDGWECRCETAGSIPRSAS